MKIKLGLDENVGFDVQLHAGPCVELKVVGT
jgi:hypothetical protein